jgi:hypothetical protein
VHLHDTFGKVLIGDITIGIGIGALAKLICEGRRRRIPFAGHTLLWEANDQEMQRHILIHFAR